MKRNLVPRIGAYISVLILVVSCAGIDPVIRDIPEDGSDLMDRIKPVFVMPRSDIDKGNGIEAVFFAENTTEDGAILEITVVFRDEDHPLGITDGCYDFYRSLRYRRVRDVETFFFHFNIDGVHFSRIDFPNTYGGEQVFFEKKVKHFSAEVPAEKFEYTGSHPIIYITTWNHMFCEKQTNQGLETEAVGDYPVFRGNRADVEALIGK